MILAEAATTVLPSAAGWGQLGLIAGGIGFLVLFLLPSDKPKEGEAKSGWHLPSLTTWALSKGSGKAAVTPTVGEAYDLLTRLDLLSGGRVDAYKAGVESARKHLTWLKDSDGGDVAAP